MSDEDDYGIGKPIDDDYIDVEKSRAEVSQRHEKRDEEPEVSRTPKAAGHARRAADDRSHTFASDAGSGAASAIDERIDDEAIIEHDGRASTRTFFYPSEAADEQRFRRLIQWQEDKWSGMKNAQRAADRRRTIGTFCGAVEMAPRQRDRVQHIVEGLNLSHMAHYSSDEVILAVISLVANESDRFIRDESQFRKLMRAVGTDAQAVRRCRHLVRDKSHRF